MLEIIKKVIGKKIGLGVLIVYLIGCMPLQASIHTNSNIPITTMYSKKIDGKSYTRIAMNTEGFKKGYYTKYFSQKLTTKQLQKLVNISSAIAFGFQNESDIPVAINIAIIQKNKGVFVVEDGYAVGIGKNFNELKRLDVQDGNISIPPYFDGKIYIPFIEELSLQTPIDIGITVTQKENVQSRFMISDFTILREEDMLEPSNIVKIEIVGDKEVMIPDVGESIAIYAASIEDIYHKKISKEVKWKLQQPYLGISLTTKGKLIVQKGVLPTTITIEGDVPSLNGMQQMKIDLVSSKMKDKSAEDGTKLTVPLQKEITPIQKEYSIFREKKFQAAIRMILLGICLVVIVFIYYWTKKEAKH